MSGDSSQNEGHDLLGRNPTFFGAQHFHGCGDASLNSSATKPTVIRARERPGLSVASNGSSMQTTWRAASHGPVLHAPRPCVQAHVPTGATKPIRPCRRVKRSTACWSRIVAVDTFLASCQRSVEGAA